MAASDEEALHRLEQAWKYASGDVRRAFLQARYREQGAAGESTIQIMGQVNATNLSPGVQMAWEGRVVQWTPEEAIRHAFNILEVTVAAEGDAFLMQFVTERIGAEREKAAQLLMDFRRWREESGRRQAQEG
jgi:hypothetical protein